MNEVRDQISALIYTYAERLDSGDLKGVAALFGRGRYGAQGGPRVEGAAAVERLLNSRIKLYDGVPRTQHVTTNLVIELDDSGERAIGRSRFSVFQALKGAPPQPIVLGRYFDAFARGSSGWYFTEREIRMDLVGDLSGHIRTERVEA